MVSKYRPTFLGDCQKAIDWSKAMVHSWLCENMLKDDSERDNTASHIVDILSSHKETFTHSKHIHYDDCIKLGIKVMLLEQMGGPEINGCKDLQDCVLTIHHTYMHTFSNSTAVKIVENHKGAAMIVTQA